MARFTIPAGKAPVIQDGRLVGLTPVLDPSKVDPMTTTDAPTTKVLGRTLTSKEQAENAAYKAAHAALTADLGRPPTADDDGYWTLPKWTSGDTDPELVEQIAQDNALVEGRTYEAPETPADGPSSPATAPAAPVKVKAPTAAPDASGVIYVPGKVCRDCSARIERKPGAGRPPAKCLACRAKDAQAAAEKAARKAAGK